MEKAGLLERRRDPSNRRNHIIELAAPGEAAITRLAAAAFAFDQQRQPRSDGHDHTACAAGSAVPERRLRPGRAAVGRADRSRGRPDPTREHAPSDPRPRSAHLMAPRPNRRPHWAAHSTRASCAWARRHPRRVGVRCPRGRTPPRGAAVCGDEVRDRRCRALRLDQRDRSGFLTNGAAAGWSGAARVAEPCCVTRAFSVASRLGRR
jgi:hypothetical protein